MPLLRIDLVQGWAPGAVAALSAAIHGAVVAEFGIPERDCFHIVTEHPAGSIVAQDAGLGFVRGPGVVMVQVFTQRGRSSEAKGALFRAIAGRLAALGVGGEDVFIGYGENGPEDWSFGFGRAQFVTGARRAEPGDVIVHDVVRMSVQTFDRTNNVMQSVTCVLPHREPADDVRERTAPAKKGRRSA